MNRELAPPPNPRNHIAFPRELREAIPDLHSGRVLELDAISGEAAHTLQFGPRVELRLVACETGKLNGQYVVLVGLRTEAARQLAATLTKLADQADQAAPVDLWTQ
jgi:hypothetical protein